MNEIENDSDSCVKLAASPAGRWMTVIGVGETRRGPARV